MNNSMPMLKNLIKELPSPEEFAELINIFNSVVLKAYPSLYLENKPIEIISPLTLKRSLEPDHVISLFIDEHDNIFGFIIELDKSLKNIQQIFNYKNAREELKNMIRNLNLLIGSEAHNQKEEAVLFPEMAKRTGNDLLSILKKEHDKIRKFQEELHYLLLHINPMNYSEFMQKIVNIGNKFCSSLKGEINKENYILYPVALKIIKEEETWQKMKNECYLIGPCSYILPLPSIR